MSALMVNCTAGGRREPVTLGKILKFVTGREFEPVLGFSVQPRIEFDENISLEHANTCTCQLRLPVQSSHYDFNLLDISFVNDYFGDI